MSRTPHHRSLLVPVVPQVGALDCGPAALAAVLQGFGLPASRDQLRDACHTSRDGTSIDALEEVATQMGLLAEQILVPAADPTFAAAACAPCILVVARPGGAAHFIVLWRLHARRAQIMDPAAGRSWPHLGRLERELYRHRARVPAAAWHRWAASPPALHVLAARLAALGVAAADRQAVLTAAAAATSWRPLAALAAAERFLRILAAARAVRRGREASRLLRQIAARALAAPEAVPPDCWPVYPAPPAADGLEQLLCEGAVLVRFARPPGIAPPRRTPATPPPARAGRPTTATRHAGQATLLAAATGAALVRFAETAWVAAAFVMLDAAPAPAPVPRPVAGLLAAGGALAVAGLLLESAAAATAQTLGRHRETRMRQRFLAAIPNLPDRFLRTRPTGDLAWRAHRIAELRRGPRLLLAAQAAALDAALASAGLIWLDPRSAPEVLAAAAGAAAVVLVMLPRCAERERRVRASHAALAAAALDALQGAAAARAHTAAPALRRRHEDGLAAWLQARRAADAASAGLAAATQAGMSLAVAALVLGSIRRTGAGPHTLLLAFWAHRLAAAAQRLSGLAGRELARDRTLRRELAELLAAARAPDNTAAAPATAAGAATAAATAGGAPSGIALTWRGCTVQSAGRPLLQGLDLAIPAGQHVALLGASGAGKSTLLATLLGWHPLAAGTLELDRQPLDPVLLRHLRPATAWCAPEVALWHASWLANLGCDPGADSRAPTATHPPPPDLAPVEALRQVQLLDRLRDARDGLQESLGEAGNRLSGGEAQRLRLARALTRPGVRLALLDEPFRGLAAGQRRELLAVALARWRTATLLCVTHAPAEAAAFDRVIILDSGQLVEDGPPRDLAQRQGSRYRALLDAELAAAAALATPAWRHLELAGGSLRPAASKPGE